MKVKILFKNFEKKCKSTDINDNESTMQRTFKLQPQSSSSTNASLRPLHSKSDHTKEVSMST